jgi:hypothetical protein
VSEATLQEIRDNKIAIWQTNGSVLIIIISVYVNISKLRVHFVQAAA